MIVRTRLAAAVAATIALGACSGGGSGTMLTNPIPPATPVVTTTQQSTLRIVGIGDSLTAGEQSGRLNGFDVPAGAPGGPFQATQPHGFFSLLYAQANQGGNASANQNPATSVLPLIGPPGLAPSNCDPANRQTIGSAAGGLAIRLNPATTPFDLAFPGATMHAAVAMIGPISTTVLPQCAALPSNDPATVALAGLNTLLFDESSTYYPVLGTFGAGVTQLQAAQALHAPVATVWLGSNEILRFIFSGGNFPVPSTQQFGADLSSIIGGLRASGTKAIAVANLVDILKAASFVPVANVAPTIAAQIAVGKGVSPVSPAFGPTVAAIAGQIGPYVNAVEQANGLVPGGYVILNGVQRIGAALAAAQATGTAPAVFTFNPGESISAAVATQAQALNDAYNATIGATVTAAGAGVALVDIHGLLASAPVIPNTRCCSASYGGGLTSADGSHPSNTGYAFIAQAFIGVLDQALGQSIPPLSPAQIAAIYATDPYAPNPR